MAEYLTMKQLPHNLFSVQYIITTLLCLVTFFMAFSANAGTIKDPTQPPPEFYTETNTDVIPTGPVLQSVMIGSNYRAAIINGQKVLLGKKYEQATLIKLNEHEAVLRYPDKSTQTLVLGYGIDKKIVKPNTTPRGHSKVSGSTK